VSEFTASVLVWTTLRTWLRRASGDQFHAGSRSAPAAPVMA